ncbi:MAG: HNH endonuclease [Anaerolineaceae bacterium]|nr:HNH endonuclease [Anaerolineaceae bacterium]
MGRTRKEIEDAVSGSRSIADVLRKLGLVPRGGNYASVKRKIKEYEIDISGLDGRRWANGIPNMRHALTLEEFVRTVLVVDGKAYGTAKIKKNLFKFGLIEEKCSKCDLGPIWIGKRLELQLDHINGDRSDNRLENLRRLCPNCHSQTGNFCGKKSIADKRLMSKGVPRLNYRRVVRPPLGEVQAVVEDHGFCEAGRRYGVSDNTVRKWLARGVQ